MKPFRRSGLADLLSLIAFTGMIVALLLPWYVEVRPRFSWPIGFHDELFPVPGALFVCFSAEDFMKSPNLLAGFSLQGLVISVASLILVFVAWASRHYLIANYFALIGLGLSVAFFWTTWNMWKYEFGIYVWCAAYSGLVIANLIGWRWKRRQPFAEQDHDETD